MPPDSSRAVYLTRCCSRSEEHTSELQSLTNLVCRLLLEKKKSNGGGQERRRGGWGGLRCNPRGSLYRHQRERLQCPEQLSEFLFFFNDTATTEIYTLSLHDALPILENMAMISVCSSSHLDELFSDASRSEEHTSELQSLAYLVCRLLLETTAGK